MKIQIAIAEVQILSVTEWFVTPKTEDFIKVASSFEFGRFRPSADYEKSQIAIPEVKTFYAMKRSVPPKTGVFKQCFCLKKYGYRTWN